MLNTVELDERITKCERILEDNPQSQIFAALADVLRKKGELDQAFRVCRQGLRMHPDYGPGRLVMAKINFDRKMYDWAEKELETAIDLDGRTRSTDLLEIELMIERGFLSKAKVVLDKLKAADPGNEYYRLLESRIDEAKANKKAKLAETEEFYRVKVREDKADEFGKALGSAADQPITFDTALDIVSTFPNVVGAFYTNCEGMPDKSTVPEGIDLELYSASLSEAFRFVASAIGSIELGVWEELLIETSDTKYVLLSLGDRVLAAICQSNVNVGSLKLKLLKITEALRKE